MNFYFYRRSYDEKTWEAAAGAAATWLKLGTPRDGTHGRWQQQPYGRLARTNIEFPWALQGLLHADGELLRRRQRRLALLLRAHPKSGLHIAALPPYVPVPAARVRPDPDLAIAR